MPAGLQVFDPTGVNVVDTSFFLGRIVGSVSTGFSSGSVSADLTGGTPFAFPVVIYAAGSRPNLGTPGGAMKNPSITATSSGISWTFPSGFSGGNFSDCIIYYGVY